MLDAAEISTFIYLSHWELNPVPCTELHPQPFLVFVSRQGLAKFPG